MTRVFSSNSCWLQPSVVYNLRPSFFRSFVAGRTGHGLYTSDPNFVRGFFLVRPTCPWLEPQLPFMEARRPPLLLGMLVGAISDGVGVVAMRAFCCLLWLSRRSPAGEEFLRIDIGGGDACTPCVGVSCQFDHQQSAVTGICGFASRLQYFNIYRD